MSCFIYYVFEEMKENLEFFDFLLEIIDGLVLQKKEVELFIFVYYGEWIYLRKK